MIIGAIKRQHDFWCHQKTKKNLVLYQSVKFFNIASNLVIMIVGRTKKRSKELIPKRKQRRVRAITLQGAIDNSIILL